MPNSEDLKNRAAARELRKANRQAAVEQAHAEAVQATDVQQANQEARARVQAAIADRAASGRPELAKPKPTPRATIVRAAKAEHEAEAAKDAMRMPSAVDVDGELTKWDGRGTPPLHVLNAMAAQTDTQLRDEGKEVANAAGKAAYEVYVGKLGGKRNRYSRMRAQIAAGEAHVAASRAKAAETTSE